MADESLQNAPIKDERKTHIPVVLKVAEIFLSIFAVGLIVDPFNSFMRVFNKPRTKVDDIAFIYITIGGYMLINSILIITHLLGDRVPKRTFILFSSVGCLFHTIAAGIIVHNWRKLIGDYVYVQNNAIYPSKMYMDMLLSGSIFTFINAAVFAADVYVTFKYT